ncbi:hypothetical protein ACFW4M_10720 [Streptomyces sp. NPDC058794]|uniref:hypothetical protein n=1 Tax=unclassified Streptomyces TaxID=2593676 RepID=UPI0036954B96
MESVTIYGYRKTADWGATQADTTLNQVGGFQVTRLPAEEREFPESTATAPATAETRVILPRPTC